MGRSGSVGLKTPLWTFRVVGDTIYFILWKCIIRSYFMAWEQEWSQKVHGVRLFVRKTFLLRNLLQKWDDLKCVRTDICALQFKNIDFSILPNRSVLGTFFFFLKFTRKFLSVLFQFCMQYRKLINFRPLIFFTVSHHSVTIHFVTTLTKLHASLGLITEKLV